MGEQLTEFKVMRQEAYDAKADGIVDSAEATVIGVTAGIGGINAYQVVMIDPITGVSIPADGTNNTHAGHVVGMALANIAEGEDGFIQQIGGVENLSWDLDPGEIYYLTVAGTISKTPPAIGFWQRIGIAKDSVTLIINLGEPIKVI
jgi:hypothetical protein